MRSFRWRNMFLVLFSFLLLSTSLNVSKVFASIDLSGKLAINSYEINQNDEIDVPIYYYFPSMNTSYSDRSGNIDYNSGINFSLKFDQSIINIVSFSNGEYNSNIDCNGYNCLYQYNPKIPKDINSTGRMQLAWSFSDGYYSPDPTKSTTAIPPKTTGILFIMKFKAIKSGVAQISIDPKAHAYINYCEPSYCPTPALNDYYVTTYPGYIKVNSTDTPTPSPTSITNNVTNTPTVSIKNQNNGSAQITKESKDIITNTVNTPTLNPSTIVPQISRGEVQGIETTNTQDKMNVPTENNAKNKNNEDSLFIPISIGIVVFLIINSLFVYKILHKNSYIKKRKHDGKIGI